MNDAVELGCVGPMARASGLPVDYRMADDEGAYKELHFHPITETARRLPGPGEGAAGRTGTVHRYHYGVPGKPAGRGHRGAGTGPSRRWGNSSPGWNSPGEALYYVKGNGTKEPGRLPPYAHNTNLPALVKMLKGCELADVPNIILASIPASAAVRDNACGKVAQG